MPYSPEAVIADPSSRGQRHQRPALAARTTRMPRGTRARLDVPVLAWLGAGADGGKSRRTGEDPMYLSAFGRATGPRVGFWEDPMHLSGPGHAAGTRTRHRCASVVPLALLGPGHTDRGAGPVHHSSPVAGGAWRWSGGAVGAVVECEGHSARRRVRIPRQDPMNREDGGQAASFRRLPAARAMGAKLRRTGEDPMYLSARGTPPGPACGIGVHPWFRFLCCRTRIVGTALWSVQIRRRAREVLVGAGRAPSARWRNAKCIPSDGGWAFRGKSP